MTRIDRAFYTVPWEEIYTEAVIQPLSSSTSDHCPLIIQPLAQVPTIPMFRFEAHWTEMHGYKECVHAAWNQPINQNFNAMLTLHIKLTRTAKALWRWSRQLIPHGKLAAAICREVILQLEGAQENRELSTEEKELKTLLKTRLLGLAAIERSRARQRSRITWIKKGDANTNYFHIIANNRKKKNYIQAMHLDSEVYTSQLTSRGWYLNTSLLTLAPPNQERSRLILLNWAGPPTT